jgi:RNA polymerase sigma-70 factor (ECF subfamily)
MSLLIEQRELLRRFKAGERRALEEVYRHYAPAVAAFLQGGFTFTSRDRTLRFSGYTQPFDLDNALQETFVRAFKESARLGYDGLHPYKSYVMAIARNLVLDEFRNREVAMSPFLEARAVGDVPPPRVGDDGAPVAAVTDAPSGQLSAEHEFLRQELGQLYATFVERLSDKDRTFFRARFEEEKTQVQAGEVAGLSHMQARTLEKKLRQRFLSHMQDSGYLEGYGAPAAKDARDEGPDRSARPTPARNPT